MMPALETVKGYLLLGTGLAACPCFWPVWIGLASGTALGGLLADNLMLLGVASGVYFLLAVGLAVRYLGDDERWSAG